MSKQQLYINDVAVDMPAEDIKLKVESNIFSDASKIKTAHSYNIALPRTVTNDAVLGLAYVPSAETGGKTTHKYLTASLYMDGVPLFTDGKAVVTSVEDKGYNLTLLWGLLSIFDYVKDEGLDLCDLPMSKFYPYPVNYDGIWLKLTSHITFDLYTSGMNNDIYNGLSSDGKKNADYYPWGLMSATANDLLDFICDVYGLELDISPWAQSRIDKLHHPLTSLKTLAKGEKVIINLKGAWIYSGGVYRLGFMMPTMIDADTVDYAPYGMVTNVHTATEKWQANNAVYMQDSAPYHNRLINKTSISVEKVRVYGYADTTYFSATVDGEQVGSHASGGVQTIDHTWDAFDVKDSQIFIWLESPDKSSVSSVDLNVEITVNDIGDIGTGMWWNTIRNYPQMGVVAYLNEILAHIGGCIIGSVTEKNKLRIVTFDEVAQASPINYDIQGTKSITMSLEGQAQRNIYTHKENDDAGLDYTGEGVIYTNDDTLTIERKAFESKFKVPRNTIVRLFEVENSSDGNGAKWVGGSDYITGWDEDLVILKNTGQDFERTISNYYTNYEGIVSHPKEVNVIVRLNVLELMKFNFEKPAYIKQLGCKYLVKSIENESGDNYKLTLVQI